MSGIGLNNSRAAKIIHHLSSHGHCRFHPATESSVRFAAVLGTGLSGSSAWYFAALQKFFSV
jgi:hypothetical protein